MNYPNNMAVSSQQLHRQILQLLRNGPLGMYTIAADLHQAPFRIRAELRALRRHRLVTDDITPAGHNWELTNTGHHLANAAHQLEMNL